MLPEKLYTIESSDWNRVEQQFVKFYPPIYVLVTENKGSLDEARTVYIDAFIYYARSLELHGPSVIAEGEKMVYSFARKLWVKKLQNRRADTSFIRHRCEFYELDDAFDDIDLIDKRTDLVSKKLAEIGEPGRTLTLEYIGHGKEIEEVMRRLGFANQDRAYTNLISCLRRLIEVTEKRKVNLDDEAFATLIKHSLHPDEESVPQALIHSDEAKIALALISRTLAIVRGYVKRKERLIRLREISKRQLPDNSTAFEAINKAGKTKKKMKPIYLIFSVVFIAVAISALTSFGIMHIDVGSIKSSVEHTDLDVTVVDSFEIEEEIAPIPEAPRYATAFAIASPGYYLTSSDVGSRGAHCVLYGEETLDIAAEVIYSDTALGLAVVFDPSGDLSNLPYMPAPKSASIGESIFSVGFSDGEFHYSQGVVAKAFERYSQMELSAAAIGAPVFTQYGQWIGVIIKGDEVSNKVRVLPVEVVQGLLGDLDEDYPKVLMPRRNGLYYDDRPKQVDKIRPQIWKIKLNG